MYSTTTIYDQLQGLTENDLFNPELQKRIEDNIRKKNIDDNYKQVKYKLTIID